MRVYAFTLYLFNGVKEHENLKTLFNYMDCDKDGMLNVKEALNLWGLLGYLVDSHDITKYGSEYVTIQG